MYKRYFLFLVMAVFLGTARTLGQVDRTTVNHAVRVLKNIDTDETKEWAISILERAAVNDTSAYAMNCLGIAYMSGIGVDADSVKAVAWLENAGVNGYADAYHNLGMIFKYSRCGVRQNFDKAYRYYSAGAEKGSVLCMYDKGFMLYKGLGCRQDYLAASECFSNAAEESHSPSLYMLGLCYRNGYGVEKDAEKASYYLNRSAILGFRDAIDELERPNEETYIHEIFQNSDISLSVPDAMPETFSEINDTNLIAGCYQGYLVMYDWSGKFILGEKPLVMNVTRDGSEIAGSMIVGTDTVPFKADITAENRLVFKKSNLMLNERYSGEKAVKYRMDDVVFDVWTDKICGRLNLYSLKLKEPERPMYFELQRNEANKTSQDEKYDRITITPNPFVADFKAAFELLNDADVQVRIFNKNGMLVWQQDLGLLDKGKHEVVLSPDIMSGMHIINIKAGTQILRNIIVKEEM